MKKTCMYSLMVALAAMLAVGCFVSDHNDDNPANTVSPSSTLTGDCVLTLIIEKSILNTTLANYNNPETFPFTKALVHLANSDGSPIPNAVVTISIPDDDLGRFVFSQDWIKGMTPKGTTGTLVTGEDGWASIYILTSLYATCYNGSFPVVATGPYSIDYGRISLVADPLCEVGS